MAKRLSLAPYLTEVVLVKDQKDFNKELKKLGLPSRPALTNDAGGMTHSFGTGRQLLCIICIDPARGELVELVSHEVAHVVLEIWRHLQERDIGHEANAYLTGYLVRQAMEYYED